MPLESVTVHKNNTPEERIFVLHGSNEIDTALTFRTSAEAQKANCALAEIYLKSPFFEEMRFENNNGTDSVAVRLKSSMGWDKIISTPGKKLSLENLFRERIERDLKNRNIITTHDGRSSNEENLTAIRTYLSQNLPPVIKSHGGNVVAKDLQDGVLTMAFSGACADGCIGTEETTKRMLDNLIRMEFPGIVKQTKSEKILSPA